MPILTTIVLLSKSLIALYSLRLRATSYILLILINSLSSFESSLVDSSWRAFKAIEALSPFEKSPHIIAAFGQL
jgi:hypothetical protein